MAHFFMDWHAQELPAYTIPQGYSIRSYSPGDENGWFSCCNGGALGTENWTEGQFAADMLKKEGVTPESIFFAVDDQGNIAATATAVCQKKQGYMHMVAVNPEYRGKGLGKAVCLKVMQYLVEKGYKHVVLETDDFRESAIHIYEWLGFERTEVENNNGI